MWGAGSGGGGRKKEEGWIEVCTESHSELIPAQKEARQRQRQAKEMETDKSQGRWARSWGQRPSHNEKLSHCCSSGL